MAIVQTTDGEVCQATPKHKTVTVGSCSQGQDASGEWGPLMSKATEQYEKERDARRKTKREKDRWPEKGYDSLKDVAKKLKKQPAAILSGAKHASSPA